MLTSLSTIVAKSLAAFWVQETALTNALITLKQTMHDHIKATDFFLKSKWSKHIF